MRRRPRENARFPSSNCCRLAAGRLHRPRRWCEHVIDHTKEELLSFSPDHPDYRYKLWVRVVTPDSVWYHVFWRRIALALALLTLAGWLSAAAGVWAFVKFQRGYTDARSIDLVFYPWRQEDYRTGLGQHYLQTGRAALEKKNYREGYRLLQAGLTRVPNDVPGRRLLAYTQVHFGRADLALKTLAEGAELASADLDYLKLLFALLLETHEDERLIFLAKKLLPPEPDSVLTHQFIALQAATAHFERGRYDETERIVGEWRLGNSLEGAILLAKCDWERGYTDLAMVRLEREIARFPKRDELYLHLVRYHRSLGHADEARRYALLRQFNNPASPGPRIDLLHTYRSTDDLAAAQRELTTFLADFSADPSALILLAWFAVDTVQPALTARLTSLAHERSYPLNAFNLARVQANLAAQHYQIALDLALTALREENEDTPHLASTLNGLRCLALYGLKDFSRAELMLNSFLGHANLRASDALLLAKQLLLAGATASARSVLDRASVLDPLNQAALGELVRLDASLGNRDKLAENLPKLLRLRKPSRAVLEETLLRLDRPADAPLRDQIRAALTRASATPAP